MKAADKLQAACSRDGRATAGKAKVLLVGVARPDEGSLQAQLHSLGYVLEIAAGPREAFAVIEAEGADLVVIDATAPDVDGPGLTARVKQLTFESAVPVMLACLPRDLRAEVNGRDVGADDCFTKPIRTEVLGARIRLLLRNRDLELSLRRQNVEYDILNRELIDARRELDRELELAKHIQRSLLPERPPELERFAFAAALRSSGEVSGDFYDIYRLDETHYGFYIADAIGHGVPAALLTIFVKKGIQTREITPDGYRLLPPGEVLTRLNRDIISEELSANPFVTLFCATLNVETAEVTYASGGHPPAIILGADGSVRPLLSEGALLGIFESDFTTGKQTLNPGDQVVLYTDGIEQARSTSGKAGLDALIEYLAPGSGEAPSGEEPREAFTSHVEATLDALVRDEHEVTHRDDVAVLVLKMLA